jgi:hypothetical protein
MTAFVHVLVSKDGSAVVAAEGEMKASVGKDLVDEPEVVEEFEAPGLESFSSGSGKVGGGFIDDAEVDASAREFAGEGQAGGSCSYDQYGCLSEIPVGIRQSFPLRFILGEVCGAVRLRKSLCLVFRYSRPFG